MINDVVKRLISPFASTDYEDVKKILSEITVEEFPLLIEKLTDEKRRAEEKLCRDVEYWTDTAQNNSHSMEGYCDNEARACSRGEEAKQTGIDQVIDQVRSIQKERESNLGKIQQVIEYVRSNIAT
ncbi:MAG: hypothetical protein WC788_07590 [Candidatus Paceibacterota bacterium]